MKFRRTVTIGGGRICGVLTTNKKQWIIQTLRKFIINKQTLRKFIINNIIYNIVII